MSNDEGFLPISEAQKLLTKNRGDKIANQLQPMRTLFSNTTIEYK